MNPLRLMLATLVAAALCVALPRTASADTSVIKRPGAHPRYSFEAEPHLLFGAFDGAGDNQQGWGPGVRGTVEIIDNGFISKINNTVGIGFGADWLFYGDVCHTNNSRVRVCDKNDRFVFPVVMQWNFWLSRNWSVFGEPGLAFDIRDDKDNKLRLDPFVFYAGGRFHFNDSVALTMRAGWPTFSVGASFFL